MLGAILQQARWYYLSKNGLLVLNIDIYRLRIRELRNTEVKAENEKVSDQ